jgi:multidrug resistance efflux pump
MSEQSILPHHVAESWLALQCQIVPGVVRAALFPAGESDSEFPVAQACWPQGGKETAGLRVAGARALEQNRPVVCCEKRSPGGIETVLLNIACPVVVDGSTCAVIAVELENSDEQRQRAVMQMLQWGSLWLQFSLRNKLPEQSPVAAKILRIVATSLEPDKFHSAATATATELASALPCDRVSVGFMQGDSVKLAAMSNSANFNSKTNLVRDLELAMAEALDQQGSVLYPQPDPGSNQVHRAHAQLCQQQRSGHVLSVPLASGQKLVGVMSFERAQASPFDADTIEQCEVAASLLGPVLELKRQGERHVLRQALDGCGTFLTSLLGPAHIARKLFALSLCTALVLMSTLNGNYRSTGNAVLEGSIQRVVVAPMDGFIKSANARPGDLVTEGEVLGTLDDEELKLEHLRWTGQRAQLRKEYREALGNRERTQVGILSAEIAQAQAQLELLDQQLTRTQFVAPFDGVIVSGDLSQELGSPVERGRILFTVAPLNSYRVAVMVEEQDVFEIIPGQIGDLVLSARPEEVLPLTVTSVTPVSTAQDGMNFFRVEANLNAVSTDLRPGMQGVAKINIEQRKLIWIWTHRLVNWLRLWSWSWLA